MLAPADLEDKYQIWIKEISYAKPVKDNDAKPAFALVNKGAGKAIKHGFGPDHLVQLAQFDQNYLDSSLLWTESDEKEPGFREIRMQSNTSAVFHAFYVNQSDSNKALLELRAPISGAKDQRWKFQEITLSDVGDSSTTTPEKPSNEWDLSKADISFDGSRA
ncbi:Stress responsive protein [Rhynchospora pubera]|uniref:Stress responsive protein n=1 Tax=Rhynchospora pubera TaxID=906938 RepID=A0AAV8EID5_9POAL|nr:Stress responsive protein [Rhynchospora pubera]